MNSDYILNNRTFDVQALVAAFCFDAKPHAQPYWEEYPFSQIFYILDGSGEYITEEGSWPIESGMVFFRPAGKRSCYRWNTPQAKFALIDFVCHSPAMDLIGTRPIPILEEEVFAIMDIIRTMIRSCEPRSECSGRISWQVKQDVPAAVCGFICSSLERFLAMIYCRVNKIDLLANESATVANHVDENNLVSQVKEFLKQQVSQPLTLSDVCQLFGLSQTALTSKFRRTTKQSVMQYFTDLKITEAKRRIRSGERVAQIAEELGFSTQSYFSKVFKARTGMTPTQYSRQVSKRRVRP